MERNPIQEMEKWIRERGNIPDHIKVGDIDRFLDKLGIKTVQGTDVGSIYGLPVHVSKYLPADKACLVDKTGKIIAFYNV